MSNLDTDDTGLPAGIIGVSTAQAAHGPRVKFSLKPGREGFSVSVLAEPAVVAPRMDQIDRSLKSYIDPVIRWVALNHEALSRFWFEGTTWTRKETNLFFDGLAKL